MNSESQQVGDIETIEEVNFTKAGSAEFAEIVLKVGPGGARRQRFSGRLLGDAKQFTKAGAERVRVYASQKGKYVVHRQAAEWTDLSVIAEWVTELKKRNWRSFDLDEQTWSDYTVTIVDSIEELRDLVPAKIYRTLGGADEHPVVEDLDI